MSEKSVTTTTAAAQLESLTKAIHAMNISINALNEKINTFMEIKNEENKQRALELGTMFVQSIMEHEYELIPDSGGMTVLRNVVMLETKEIKNVILQNITIPFWQQCIKIVNTSNKQCRVAAIGASGIGKTTATAILIRMLLKQGMTVVYLVQMLDKKGWYYEFVPGLYNSIATNVYPESIQRKEISSLLLKSTFFIVDSGRTRNNCNPPHKFAPKVILVTPLDSGHWGGPDFIIPHSGVCGFLEIMPLWTLEELLSARQIVCPNLPVGIVRDMYRLFDGVPRKMFKHYSNANILDWKKTSIPKISFFDQDEKERKAILERMICAYIHENQQSQADVPYTRHCYNMCDRFSAIDSYWITNVKVERFKGTAQWGILYHPEIVDEMMKLVISALNNKRVTEGIMIQGPHGIGKSHSIVNLVCKLLYDSDGKYLVTFVPDCEKWSNLGNLYEAICNSFGCTRADIGANVEEEYEVQFEDFITLIAKILSEKGMKWVFVFDQINALFARPEHKESKNVATLPFPFHAIKSVMKAGHITTIISASTNNEIFYSDSHPDFIQYDHCCHMSADETNSVFQKVAGGENSS